MVTSWEDVEQGKVFGPGPTRILIAPGSSNRDWECWGGGDNRYRATQSAGICSLSAFVFTRPCLGDGALRALGIHTQNRSSRTGASIPFGGAYSQQAVFFFF